MRKFLIGMAAAAAALSLAGAASAANPVNAAYYSNYTETVGTGITFSNQFFSETLPDVNFDFGDIGCPANARPSATCAWGGDFTGAISVGATGTYNLTIGSDDASYLFIDSVLVGALPGTHGYYEGSFMTALTAGSHAFELQYFNGPCCGAAIHFVLGEGVTYTPPTGGAVPEPASWAMLIVGFGGAGAMMRRRRTAVA